MVDSIIVAPGAEVTRRKQQRSARTRLELLRSARAIFARDGFEHARLEDIAAKAGRTRGAFYTNFKDKEDVFFAIFEADIDRGYAEVEMLLSGLGTTEERMDALTQYLIRLSKDRERTLLNLEFKMYAIRHPLKRKRLTDLHSVMRLRCCAPGLNQLFPMLSQSAKAQLTVSLALGGMIDGLLLNHLFDSKTLNTKELANYLKRCLRAIFP